MYFILQAVNKRSKHQLPHTESKLGDVESAGHVSKAMPLVSHKPSRTDAFQQIEPSVGPSLDSGPLNYPRQSRGSQGRPAQKEKGTPEASTSQPSARRGPSRLELPADRIFSPLPSSATLLVPPEMMSQGPKKDHLSDYEEYLRLVPPPLFGKGSQRSPSVMTSATIEFGLRLSDAPSEYRVSASIEAVRSMIDEGRVRRSSCKDGMDTHGEHSHAVATTFASN